MRFIVSVIFASLWGFKVPDKIQWRTCALKKGAAARTTAAQ